MPPLHWEDDGWSGYYTWSGTINITSSSTTGSNYLTWYNNSTTAITTIENRWPVYSMDDVTGGNGWITVGRRDANFRQGEVPQLEWEAPTEHQARAQAEMRQRVEARRTAAALAESRAETLLLSMLSDEQKAAYRDRRPFEVLGSHGGLYRIHRGSIGNVEWVRADGQAGGSLCAHPGVDPVSGYMLPDPDVALGQLLALTTDEAAFVRVANVHRGARPSVGRRRRRQEAVA